MLIDSNLLDYYKTTFRLQKDFGFDMAHIETMFPFEYKQKVVCFPHLKLCKIICAYA
jgi:hypothetical protein